MKPYFSITMNNIARITSILRTPALDSSITGLPTFCLSELNLTTDLDFPIPSDLRLGHLVEKIVSHLINSSTNYQIMYENLQLIEQGTTIGEIDFILSNQDSEELIHVELAYKFYLYDPRISSQQVNNWIGPNRNDSLIEKLDKTKNKHFPLLHHNATRSKLDKLGIQNISQKLCLLTSLFIPYNSETHFSANYLKYIKGYYIYFDDFVSLDHSSITYYIPHKKEWGIDPSQNDTWETFSLVYEQISESITKKQALLCWQKHKDSYSAFFIVWWKICTN